MKSLNENIHSFATGDLILNISIENKDQLYNSYKYLEKTRKINIIATLILILFGLIGNSLIVIVFSKKRFRLNSSNVFLLCLAINDSLFLIIHLFEDTLRTYEEIYTYDTSSLNSTMLIKLNNLLSVMNITDQFSLACRMFSYLRYVLRFISAYIIVAFTFQRLTIVSSPLKNKFKTKKSAWILVSIIIATSLIFNSWVPYFFELQHFDQSKYCEIIEEYKYNYYMLTNIYIFTIVIIPVVSVFVSNLLIIIITKQAANKRKQMKNSKSVTSKNDAAKSNFVSSNGQNNYKQSPMRSKLSIPAGSMISSTSFCQYLQGNDSFTSTRRDLPMRRDALTTSKFDFRLKPLYLSTNQITMQTKSNSLITKMLIIISFSYALLNLPYLITWCLFYKEIKSEFPDPDSLSIQNYLFSAVQISEILYMLNYGLHFYFYCITGSRFLNQLKYLRVFNVSKKLKMKTTVRHPNFIFEKITSFSKKR